MLVPVCVTVTVTVAQFLWETAKETLCRAINMYSIYCYYREAVCHGEDRDGDYDCDHVRGQVFATCNQYTVTT